MKKVYSLISCLFFLVQLASAQIQPGASPAIGITVAGGNGPGSAAGQLNEPSGIFVDATGNVYVADQNNHRIQKWAPGASAGITVAGGNGPGFAPHQLNSPGEVFVDPSGSIYVAADSTRKWAPGATSGIAVAPRGRFADLTGNIYVSRELVPLVTFAIQRWAPGATAGVTVAIMNGFPFTFFVDATGNVFYGRSITGQPSLHLSNLYKLPAGIGSEVILAQSVAPADIFVDAAGNIYVVDGVNARILKWAPGATEGITVAGGNGQGSAANQLNNPRGVFVDAAGNIYVADQGNHRIQKFGSAAAATGLSYKYYEGDWNQLPDFSTLTPVKTGASANIDISVKPAGVEERFAFVWEGHINIKTAGTYTFSTVSDDGSRLYFFSGYSPSVTPVVDNDGLHGYLQASGSVFIPVAGFYPMAITYFNKAGGKGISLYWSGPGFTQQPVPDSAFIQPANDKTPPSVPVNLRAELLGTTSVHLDWDDATNDTGVAGYDVYINGSSQHAQSSNFTITRLIPNTTYTFMVAAFDAAGNRSAVSAPVMVTIPPGSLVPGVTIAGGAGQGPAAHQLNSPNDIFVDGSGNVYVADPGNARIQKWAPGATAGITVAGGNGSGSAANQLSSPQDVFVDPTGNIYVADGSRVQKWTSGATSGITVAGGNGSGPAANQLSSATGVFVDAAGNVYVSDQFNDRVQKWAPGATEGITVVRSISLPGGIFVDSTGNIYVGGAFGNSIQKWAPGATSGVTVVGGNGSGSAANQLEVGQKDVFVDATGNIFIADPGNDRIQKWAPGASSGVTVAGGNGRGNTVIQLFGPFGVFVDATGNIYVSDRGNHRVQKFGSSTANNGLSYKYYEGAWNSLPDFSTLSPVKTGSSPNIDISQRTAGREENFAFVWKGSINIPAAGTYTFSTVSDDGSRLYFNSLYSPTATPLVENDGLHGYVLASGTTYIPEPGTYPIAITYFNKSGGKGISVYWSGPNFDQQLIPDAAFGAPSSDVTSPGTPVNLRAVSQGTTFINLDWDDATDNLGVTGYDVYVNGVKQYTTTTSTISADGLAASTYYAFTVVAFDLAGNRSAPSASLTGSTTATSTGGLNYQVYLGDWNSLPNFSLLTPVKSGNAPNIDVNVRPEGVEDHFGIVWKGYINIPQAGTYTFGTVSDDGSELYFNSLYAPGNTPLVNNDGLHGYQLATGTTYIFEAGVYPMSIAYFNKTGGKGISVYWSGPGFSQQLIPNSAFVPAPALVTAANWVMQSSIREEPVQGRTELTRVYPVPFTDRLNIDFYNSEIPGNVSLTVCDVMGRTVYSRRAGKLGIGQHTLKIPLTGADFAQGMYLVTLQVNGKTLKTVPVLKAKR